MRTSGVAICFSANFFTSLMARGARYLKPLQKGKTLILLSKKETAHSMDELVQVDGVLAGDHLVQGALLLALALGLVLTLLLGHLLCVDCF